MVSMIFNGFAMEEVQEKQTLEKREQRQPTQNLKVNASIYLYLYMY